jgi:thioredoxin reductase
VTLDVVVIGGGPAGLSAATWLARYRRTVAVLDSRECRNRWADARHGVTVREETAVELVGARGDLRAVRLAGGDTVECELGFSIAYHPVTGLGEQLGCERDPGGYLVVDASGTAPVPGVFAAGDVTPGLQLVQGAAGAAPSPASAAPSLWKTIQ